jgi:hypothetical protein
MPESVASKTILAGNTLFAKITRTAPFTVLTKIAIKASLTLNTLITNLAFYTPIPVNGILRPNRISIVITVFIVMPASVVIAIFIVSFLINIFAINISSAKQIKPISVFHQILVLLKKRFSKNKIPADTASIPFVAPPAIFAKYVIRRIISVHRYNPAPAQIAPPRIKMPLVSKRSPALILAVRTEGRMGDSSLI